MEEFRVHSAWPELEVPREPSRPQLSTRGVARAVGDARGRVEASKESPDRRCEQPQAVSCRILGEVRAVRRDQRHPPGAGPATARPAHGRFRRAMDQVRLESIQLAGDLASHPRDGSLELRIEGYGYARDLQTACHVVPTGARQARSDHPHLVSQAGGVIHEVAKRPRDPVDRRRERVREERDPHGHETPSGRGRPRKSRARRCPPCRGLSCSGRPVSRFGLPMPASLALRASRNDVRNASSTRSTAPRSQVGGGKGQRSAKARERRPRAVRIPRSGVLGREGPPSSTWTAGRPLATNPARASPWAARRVAVRCERKSTSRSTIPGPWTPL